MKDFQLNERQREFAERNHKVLEDFLKYRGLPQDEFYDVVVFRFLRAVKQYDERDDLKQYSFRTIANNHMRSALGGHFTISENIPIKLEFGTPFTVGQTLFTSANENTSLTADKFLISQIELALDKQDNDIVTKAAEYIINYELDGGTLGANSPATHTYGTETILVNPTKSGYNFAGWYLEDTFATKIETLAAAGYTSEITLYAKWNKRSGGGGTTRYTVSFDTNGGSKLSSQTVTRNSVIKEPTTPTKDGFDFAGWYTDKELKTKYDFSAKITKSI